MGSGQTGADESALQAQKFSHNDSMDYSGKTVCVVGLGYIGLLS
jgi:hypothetical protein